MQTVKTRAIIGGAFMLVCAGALEAQAAATLSRADTARVGAILAQFHRDEVARSPECRVAGACRHSIVYEPSAQALRADVGPALSGMPPSGALADVSKPYFGLRVKETAMRLDTVVVKVDVIQRMAGAQRWSEWATELFVTRDKGGNLALAGRRTVSIQDFIVPPGA